MTTGNFNITSNDLRLQNETDTVHSEKGRNERASIRGIAGAQMREFLCTCKVTATCWGCKKEIVKSFILLKSNCRSCCELITFFERNKLIKWNVKVDEKLKLFLHFACHKHQLFGQLF
jgi:hypothetical protein